MDRETGERWWPEVSKEAFAEGVRGAVDASWRGQTSRTGEIEGRRVGFPGFNRKGRDSDRVTFTTGTIRLGADRRRVVLPRIGAARRAETTRSLHRLVTIGRARILAATLKREGAVVGLGVEVARPQPGHPDPASTVGIEVGVRVLATVATPTEVIERVPTPAPLAPNLSRLRPRSRSISRSQPGSNRDRCKERQRLQAHRGAVRRNEIHRRSTRLAQPHGRIVVEGLDAAGMLRQQGLPGARVRTGRRGAQRDAPTAPRPDRVVGVGAGRGRPVLPQLEALPRLRARPGDRLGRALDLRRLRDTPSAR